MFEYMCSHDPVLCQRPFPTYASFPAENDGDAVQARRVLRGQVYAIPKALEMSANFIAFLSPVTQKLLLALRDPILKAIERYEGNTKADGGKTNTLAALRDFCLGMARQAIRTTAYHNGVELRNGDLESLPDDSKGIPLVDGGIAKLLQDKMAFLSPYSAKLRSALAYLATRLTGAVKDAVNGGGNPAENSCNEPTVDGDAQ